MADLGIARINNDMDASNTLTRADLSDVVHRRLGLSRAESAGVVERVLHHMCHALSQGANVKISGFGTFILRDKGQRIGRSCGKRVSQYLRICCATPSSFDSSPIVSRAPGSFSPAVATL